MPIFLVYSPEYQTSRPCWDPPDPGEWGCDVVEVETDSARSALLLGVAWILRDDPDRSWAGTNRQDRKPPWAGYKVERAPDEDVHEMEIADGNDP